MGLCVLLQVRDDVIPLEVLALGGAMLVVITLIHGGGLDAIVEHYKRQAESLRRKNRHPWLAVLVFAGSILMMLFLHLAEISLWGVVLRMLGLVSNYRDAVYFSANTYTTLGMGPMALPHSWRELSPMIAIAGLFTFAWTTSELFNIVGYQHDLKAELSAKRRRQK
jgi:hypothetical protein